MNDRTEFEVVVPFSVWHRTLMPMLTNRDQIATGVLARDPGREPTGLLVENLSASISPRTGDTFAPLADWIAIAAPGGVAPETPDEWLRRLRPGYAQLLVILLVGYGVGRVGWRGWVVERGVITPLAGMRIVGPGMVHVKLAPHETTLEEADPNRWSRLAGAVGEHVVAKLRESEIAIVGCSRTGNVAAGMFAALGVRRLVLVDGDVLEPHNLDGILLATENDVGSNKAVAVGRRLVEFRSDLAVSAVPTTLNSRESESALGGTSLVVTCVDQDAPKLRVAHWCREHLVPHLDIGTGATRTAAGERQIAADVRLLLPGAGCLRCVGGLGDLEQAEYELRAPRGALPRRPPEPWNARGRLGSLITMNNIAVSVAVQSYVDLLGDELRSSVWHRLLWQPGLGPDVDSAAVAAAPDCNICFGQ